MLPEMVAAREAWEAEFLPALKLRDEQQKQERQLATDLISRGLAAINATDGERALVARKTGLAV